MKKRSLTIAGHRTSLSLEEPFWAALTEIAAADGKSVAAVVAGVDRTRHAERNLSAAVRVAVLDWYRRAATQRAITAPAGEAEAGPRP